MKSNPSFIIQSYLFREQNTVPQDAEDWTGAVLLDG
jgi:hypothetical protein